MPRWLLFVLGGVIVLGAIVVGALVFLGGVPTDELGRLVSDGAVKELRQELRPPRAAGPKVLIFALDGVGDGEFRRALADDRLPHIGSFLGVDDPEEEVWRNAFAARGALSILPSTTYAAWTAVFTGEPVARSGIPGNEWFDRETADFVAPAPVSVFGNGDALRVYSESLLAEWIAPQTLFERADVRSYASLLPQHRGADLLIQPDLGVLGELVASFAEGVTEDEETDPETYSTLDRESAEQILAAIEEHGPADLTVIYFPGVDLYTHVATPALRRQTDYLSDVLDPVIGDVLRRYDSLGVLEETYVLFVSDHGHTPALERDRNALGSGGADEWPAVLDSAGFRVRPFELETKDSTFQAVVAYQGAFAYLYLADRSLCLEPEARCDWTRPPRFKEDVLPVVEVIDRVNRTGERVPELEGTVDMIFAREPRGIADAEPFDVWNGDGLVPLSEYLTAHPRADLLDFQARLEAMGSGPLGHRTGDILLLSRYRFRDPIEERFYFSREYRSWHGSPSAQDSEIVWIIARRGESGENLRSIVQEVVGETPGQMDVTPLVLHLLDGGS